MNYNQLMIFAVIVISLAERIQIGIALISFLGVFAAWGTAYLTWRSRPALLTTKEKHSKDLWNTLEDLKRGIGNFNPGDNQPPNTDTPVSKLTFIAESTPLFNDLINHVPFDIKLFDNLETLKQENHKLELQKILLYNSTKNLIETITKIPILNQKDSDNAVAIGINIHFLNWLFSHLISRAKGKPLHIPGYSVNGDELRVSANLWAKTPDAGPISGKLDLLVSKLDKEEKGTPEYSVLEEAEKLVRIQNKVLKAKTILIDLVNETQAIPIFTGDCKHLRRATEPLFRFGRRAPNPNTDQSKFSPSKEVKRFVDSLSLASTFLALSTFIISVDLDNVHKFNFQNVVFIIALVACFYYFVRCSIELLIPNATRWYRSVFENSKLFVSMLWTAVVVIVVFTLIQPVLKTPDYLHAIYISFAASYLIYILIAVVFRFGLDIYLKMRTRRNHS